MSFRKWNFDLIVVRSGVLGGSTAYQPGSSLIFCTKEDPSTVIRGWSVQPIQRSTTPVRSRKHQDCSRRPSPMPGSGSTPRPARVMLDLMAMQAVRMLYRAAGKKFAFLIQSSTMNDSNGRSDLYGWTQGTKEHIELCWYQSSWSTEASWVGEYGSYISCLSLSPLQKLRNRVRNSCWSYRLRSWCSDFITSIGFDLLEIHRLSAPGLALLPDDIRGSCPTLMYLERPGIHDNPSSQLIHTAAALPLNLSRGDDLMFEDLMNIINWRANPSRTGLYDRFSQRESEAR